MDNIKQVIIVRKDLNMSVGKTATQVAHASLKIFLDRLNFYRGIILFDGFPSLTQMLDENYKEEEMKIMPQETTNEYIIRLNDDIKDWINGDYTKIVLGCNSEQELQDLYKKATNKGLPTCKIKDKGYTEFNGVETYTCIAIGPAKKEYVDSITGNLSLL